MEEQGSIRNIDKVSRRSRGRFNYKNHTYVNYQNTLGHPARVRKFKIGAHAGVK